MKINIFWITLKKNYHLNMTSKESECCQEFSPEKWDEKSITWGNKPFIKESIPTFFHIPFPHMIEKKIVKMYKMANEVNVAPPKEDWLVLFHDPSLFKSELYMNVMGPVKNTNNVTISGKFETKVFDGPYNAVPKFFKEMDTYLEKKEIKAKKYYVHYAYCPKCSEKAGHNYMVLFAMV